MSENRVLDGLATLAASDPKGFTTWLASLPPDFEGVIDGPVEQGRSMTG